MTARASVQGINRVIKCVEVEFAIKMLRYMLKKENFILEFIS